jgi:hypothetical protein
MTEKREGKKQVALRVVARARDVENEMGTTLRTMSSRLESAANRDLRESAWNRDSLPGNVIP